MGKVYYHPTTNELYILLPNQYSTIMETWNDIFWMAEYWLKPFVYIGEF